MLFVLPLGGNRSLDAVTTDLQNAMYGGDAQSVRRIFDSLKRHPRAPSLKHEWLGRLVEGVGNFKNHLNLLEAITRRDFSLRDFFESVQPSDDYLEMKIWDMYQKSPSPEIAQVAAKFMAEYLSYRIRKDGDGFKPSYGQYVHGEGDNNTLADKNNFTIRRNAVIAIQNQLVDLVKNAAPETPINKAEKMLPILAELTISDVSILWERKITDLVVGPRRAMFPEPSLTCTVSFEI